KKTGLKMIYGVELYMFDIDQTYIINPSNTPLKGAKYCVFDTETTGLSARYDRIIEFGGVLIEGGRVTKRFDRFINPEMPLPEDSVAINHISEEDVADAPTFAEIWPEIKEFLGDNILVAHNATFDIGFVNASLKRMGLPPLTNPVIDTLALSHYLFPEAGRHNEGALLRNLGLNIYNEKEAHRADYDANALSDGWQEILIRLEKEHPGIVHADLANLSVNPPDPNDPDEEHKEKQAAIYNSYCRHLREYHCTVLVKNQQGLSDLYRIISEGHTTYLARVPKTPRRLINQYRENFLVGSACFNGEIFELAMTREIDQLAKAMEFYDYIELQPVENYSYLINMGRVSSKERLFEILRDIVAAAEIAGKPIVATGDCHYVNPEDKILRDVYISAKGIGNGSHPLFPPAREKKPLFPNPDQHFRSTREMLDSFMQWTTEEKAREYVIDNSNMIADQIDENVIPVSDDLFPPNANLPNSAEKLRELCYTNFENRYCGNPDPEVQARIEQVRARLNQELDGIIGHGYSVTYYIAHILIKMANEEPEHYIVGSRGSVGSSFAATMADITEVNALPPHYLCPKCHYFEWGDAKKYKSGFDLPDKICPCCGEKLVQNGQNIPFETFLGFSADKVPDIDLNFEEESQHKAHNYTKQLLGASNVFRAGTIETVAEKTAYGYVRHYFELQGLDVEAIPPAYIAYVASRCQGVKRTTGQHPGGIVVVPSDKSVFDFTAIQHPADDLNSEWLTTHYDFRSMHDEILKFDILGHVDPMAMRYYRDLTGVKIEDIPMNDPKVLSLFVSPKELNLRDNWLNQQTGAAALPEFGTDLAQRMLLEANPKCFNDLLIISGLAHGTNVWSGNAEDLILNKVTDINGVIGCRDDIMTYLISMGIPNGIA
ncbi:MAG: PolC-type DNA polymerase III, partial [Bacilli bacterium]|nr:PolC-type DNA polymerase III [Bacilli bacterium]